MVIGFVFYDIFATKRANDPADETADRPRVDLASVVPTDALALWEGSNLQEAMPFLYRDGVLAPFLNRLPTKVFQWEAAISLHCEGYRKEVCPLLAIQLPKTQDGVALLEEVADGLGSQRKIRYDGYPIYTNPGEGVSYGVCRNIMLISPSLELVKSSVLHIDKKISLAQSDSRYNAAKDKVFSRSVIHFDPRKVDKFDVSLIVPGKRSEFSALTRRFLSRFCDWISLSVSSKDGEMSFSGVAYNELQHSDASFAQILSRQGSGRRLQKMDIASMVPCEAQWLVSIRPYNAETWTQEWNLWRKGCFPRTEPDEATMNWFKDCNVQQIASFAVTISSKTARFCALRIPGYPFGKEAEVVPFLHSKNLTAMVGGLMVPEDASHSCTIGDWVFIGSAQNLEWLSSNVRSYYFFSLQDYMDQTPAASLMNPREGVLLAVVNLDRHRKEIAPFLTDRYSGIFDKAVKGHNFNCLVLNGISDGKDLAIKGSIFTKTLSQMPTLKIKTDKGTAEVVASSAPVKIPLGPFKVKNAATGRENTLSQNYTDLSLKLVDDRNKLIKGGIQMSDTICGCVEQIDLLKNGKLQMIFAAGNKIYVMDRLGNFVKPFPITLEKKVLLGPKVYDWEGNKVYSLMVLHTDNTVSMYDISGNKPLGWNDITVPERIRKFPEVFECGSRKWWVLRTDYQTIIYNLQTGLPVTDFSKKSHRLSRDTQLEQISSSEIVATTQGGDNVCINLLTGEFSKR